MPKDKRTEYSDYSASGRLLNEDGSQDHQQGRKNPQNGSNQGAPSVTPHDDAVASDDRQGQAYEDAGAKQGEKHGPTLEGAGRAVTAANVILAAVSVCTLIITGFQLYSMNGQWTAMNEQLNEMRTSNEKLEKSILAANRQANAAEAANKIASEALSSSDRAWVYSAFSHEGSVSKDTPFAANLTLKNSGKTPAINARVKYTMLMAPTSGPAPTLDALDADAPVVNFYPDQDLTLDLTYDAKMMTQNISAILDRSISIYVLARSDYEDINKKSHTHSSCGKWDINSNRFQVCPGFTYIAN